jgi:hypothetical protein
MSMGASCSPVDISYIGEIQKVQNDLARLTAAQMSLSVLLKDVTNRIGDPTITYKIINPFFIITGTMAQGKTHLRLA